MGPYLPLTPGSGNGITCMDKSSGDPDTGLSPQERNIHSTKKVISLKHYLVHSILFWLITARVIGLEIL